MAILLSVTTALRRAADNSCQPLQSQTLLGDQVIAHDSLQNLTSW